MADVRTLREVRYRLRRSRRAQAVWWWCSVAMIVIAAALTFGVVWKALTLHG